MKRMSFEVMLAAKQQREIKKEGLIAFLFSLSSSSENKWSGRETN